MNSELTATYLKDDLDLDTMKYQTTANSTSDNVFGPVWGADDAYSSMTYAPGEYLNDKDASYECFLEPQAAAAAAAGGGGEFMEWTNNTPSMLNSPVTTISEGGPGFGGFLSPTALANSNSPTWGADGADQGSPYAMADDAFATSSMMAERAAKSPPSPTSHSKSKVAKRKSKSSSSKSQYRNDGRSKSESSASSTSSHNSNASARHPNSGYGGNHNITLRTASRKPKPVIKSEDNPGLSPDSSPSSPDANAENLTSEERRARQNHNVVEKQYRNRLNSQFERLLAVLPANQADAEGSSRYGEFDDRRMSKAEVLDMARRRINALEQERKQLRAERQSLLENVNLMQRAVQRQRLGLVGNAV